jgi:hypothetical protein
MYLLQTIILSRRNIIDNTTSITAQVISKNHAKELFQKYRGHKWRCNGIDYNIVADFYSSCGGFGRDSSYRNGKY